MIRATCFNEQIAALQEKFHIHLTPFQIVAIGKHFLDNPKPEALTLEFTEEQWRQRVETHPVQAWVAEGSREFEIELLDEGLIGRIKGALGTRDDLPQTAAATPEEYQHRRHHPHA